jgi:hypothetical protein
MISFTSLSEEVQSDALVALYVPVCPCVGVRQTEAWWLVCLLSISSFLKHGVQWFGEGVSFATSCIAGLYKR